MIKPIINLINMNAKYSIDMKSYKDFNSNIDYGVSTTEATFEPTPQCNATLIGIKMKYSTTRS